MGDALKTDCEMNLGARSGHSRGQTYSNTPMCAEVAGCPLSNMKKYWEEIAGSKQRWTQIQHERMEEEVKRGIEASALGAS
jgi:hypothetical protein